MTNYLKAAFGAVIVLSLCACGSQNPTVQLSDKTEDCAVDGAYVDADQGSGFALLRILTPSGVISLTIPGSVGDTATITLVGGQPDDIQRVTYKFRASDGPNPLAKFPRWVGEDADWSALIRRSKQR